MMSYDPKTAARYAPELLTLGHRRQRGAPLVRAAVGYILVSTTDLDLVYGRCDGTLVAAQGGEVNAT